MPITSETITTTVLPERPTYKNIPTKIHSRAKYFHTNNRDQYITPISWCRSVHEKALRKKSMDITAYNDAMQALKESRRVEALRVEARKAAHNYTNYPTRTPLKARILSPTAKYMQTNPKNPGSKIIKSWSRFMQEKVIFLQYFSYIFPTLFILLWEFKMF